MTNTESHIFFVYNRIPDETQYYLIPHSVLTEKDIRVLNTICGLRMGADRFTEEQTNTWLEEFDNDGSKDCFLREEIKAYRVYPKTAPLSVSVTQIFTASVFL